MFNALSMLPAFLGVVVGIEAGNGANNWILAFSAGMFLYIALGSMVRDVIQEHHFIKTAILPSFCLMLLRSILIVQ
jgi:zinc transporter ZupT